MNYSFYELVVFFFLYAFLGWVLEIGFAAANNKKFANRGFLNGPVCPVYGYSIVFMLIFFESLKNNLFFLFLGSVIVATISELLTGMVMEKLLGRKWWDYSGYKFNFGGYVCLEFSLVWGLGAVLLLKFVQPLLTDMIRLIPRLALQILVGVLLVLLLCDFIVTAGAILKIKNQNRQMQELALKMNKLSGRLAGRIADLVQKRMLKAFPNLEKGGVMAEPAAAGKKTQSLVFAEGCCFYKLVWLFMIGSFLGDVVETIFCRVTAGVWMSRSSVVYGAFSIVWGLGIVMLTLILHRYQDRDVSFIFTFGTVIGGAYEYICSVFTELAFGTVFWDYSGIPFNLGGRINLLYCFFWGFAAVIWLKLCYPFLSKWIEKIPKKIGPALSWIFVVFMVVNMAVSALALGRYSERAAGVAADNELARLLDERFDDARMDRIYPNAKMTDSQEPVAGN